METTTTHSGKNLYSVHPAIRILARAVAGLKGKTGRTMEEWIELVTISGPEGEKERREWLKEEYGLTTNYAWWIAERAGGKGDESDPEEYLRMAAGNVEKMYAGRKAHLRPVYDALLELVLSLGEDVKACPCQTIVPIYRNHVIAEIKPTTLARVDFGLALGDFPATGRLIDTGGVAKKNRITRRIPMTTPDDIDDEVRALLMLAYTMDEREGRK